MKSRYLLLLLAFLGSFSAAARAQDEIPHQWIAKMYTEALGRAPDASGWSSSLDLFEHACDQVNLKRHAEDIYLSSEYSGLGYDNSAKLITLYRGLLNREPDKAGFDANLDLLNSGTSFSTLVTSFMDSPEFTGLVDTICAQGSYGFGSVKAITVPTTGTGFAGGTGAELQDILDSTPSGGKVFLAKKAVVRLKATLNIPAGVTLKTTGSPDRRHYALMGRLVRNSGFNGPLVTVQPGAVLKFVWVDGHRGVFGYKMDAINVHMLSGTGTTVSKSRISNTAGWSSILSYGDFELGRCKDNFVADNLITTYSSGHYDGSWADGISLACEDASVLRNHIIDPTDVGIVMFRSTPSVQKSAVKSNVVINAGNPSYGAYVVDPLHGQGVTHDFTGSKMRFNTVWNAPEAHYDIAVSVGTRAWFGEASDMGTGVHVKNNTSEGQLVYADQLVGVSGMLNQTSKKNTFEFEHENASACPNQGDNKTVASISAGFASGVFQGPTKDVLIQACIGHAPQGVEEEGLRRLHQRKALTMSAQR